MRVCEADVITLFYAFPVLKASTEYRGRGGCESLYDKAYEVDYRQAAKIYWDENLNAEAAGGNFNSSADTN